MKRSETSPGRQATRRSSPGGGVSAQRELRLEADGETHRRDCECARCEAGFTPTEQSRALAERRVAKKQGHLAAIRAAERRKTKARLDQQEMLAYFQRGNAAAEAEIARLRAARAKALADRRVEALLDLRRQGWELGLAIAEVDRRFSPDGTNGTDNDNGRRPSASTTHIAQPPARRWF